MSKNKVEKKKPGNRKRLYLMRLRVFLVFFVVGVILAWLLGRLMTVGYSLNPDQPMAGLVSFFTNRESVWDIFRDFFAEPFGIELSNIVVLICTLAGFAIPVVLCLGTIGHLDPDVVEAGSEHGTERLATEKEMESLKDRDKKRFYNNILCSEHCGLVLHPFNKKLQAASRARNLNQITFGMSGQGKTFNEVSVDILQSIGNALPPRRYGIKNILLRGKHTPDMTEAADATILSDEPTPLEETAGGFDFINTDPKGTNIREFGNMLTAAGFEVYSFNTVNFEESDRYNPLAFIPMRKYDVIEPSKINFDAEVEIFGLVFSNRQPINDHTKMLNNYSIKYQNEKARSLEGHYRACVWVEFNTEVTSQIDIDNTLEDASKSSAAKGGISPEAASLISEFEYRSSTGVIHIEIGMNELFDTELEGCVVIKFPRSIKLAQLGQHNIVDSDLSFFGFDDPDQAFDAANNLGELKISLDGIKIGDEFSDGGWKDLKIDIDVEVQQVPMPDGVQLLKTVECLACQLQPREGDKAATDPFWPASAQLLLTGLISLQFEMLPEEDWVLPVTVDLLDAMTPQTGSTMSALDVLMEQWESGKLYVGADDSSDSDTIGEDDDLVRTVSGKWVENPDEAPRSRSRSLALHCFYAIRNSAEDTFKSVLITAQMFFSRLVTPEMRWLLGKNELPLDCMGEAHQRRCLFLIGSDTDTTYSFVLSLLTFQQINLLCDKAFEMPEGRLDRHVRFILDEVMNLGNITVLNRALAVVRSRNMSITMFCQSKSQIDKTYGEHDTAIMLDNCSTMLFMGSQHQETLDMMSKRLGQQTVKSRTVANSFSKASPTMQVSEHVTSTASDVKSAAEIARTDKDYMLVFMYNQYPALDKKYPTERHPYFAYAYPLSARSARQPRAAFDELFDFKKYRDNVEKNDITKRIPYRANTREAKAARAVRLRAYLLRALSISGTKDIAKQIMNSLDRGGMNLLDVSRFGNKWSVCFTVQDFSNKNVVKITSWTGAKGFNKKFAKYYTKLKSGKIDYIKDTGSDDKSQDESERFLKHIGDMCIGLDTIFKNESKVKGE